MIISEAQVFQKLDDTTKNIVTNVSLESDYGLYDENKKFIIVEGNSDKTFFTNYKQNNNNYIVVHDIINDVNNLNEKPQNKPNGKQIIIDILTNFLRMDFISKRQIYGVVDRDFEKSYPSTTLQQRLFSDDSHDLEMMIILSDNNCLNKLNLPNFNQTVLNDTFYMAYQIGLVKTYLVGFMHYSIPHHINFDKVFEKNRLDLKKYVEYINTVSHATKKVKYEDVVKKLRYLKHIDNKNNFISFDIFKTLDKKNICEIINGHDFLEILAYFQRGLGSKGGFTEQYLNKILVNRYDFKKFENTSLFEKMKSHNLF